MPVTETVLWPTHRINHANGLFVRLSPTGCANGATSERQAKHFQMRLLSQSLTKFFRGR